MPDTSGPTDPDEFHDDVALDSDPGDLLADLPIVVPEPERTDGFAPFDPTQIRPEPPVVKGRMGLADEEGNALPEFDVRWREDFSGLAFVGSLSKAFEWLGHKFVIRTLTVDELLAVSAITKPFNETMGSGLAYRTAMAALSVVTLDGNTLPLPVEASNDSLAWAHQRFNYAKSHWYQFTIDAIYAEYLPLEEKVTQVVAAMGKALGPTGSTPG